MANIPVPPEELHPSLKDSIIVPSDVRAFIADTPSNNHLLDDVEFDDRRIWLAIRMAVSEYNETPPVTRVTASIFPGMATLIYGACYHLFSGQAALAARNQMSYSDGGLNVPIEERYGMYQQLAQYYWQLWSTAVRNTKSHRNLESGWGYVNSDYSTFPNW